MKDTQSCIRALYWQQINLFANNSEISVLVTTTLINLKTGICMFNNLIVYEFQVFTIVWACKRHRKHKEICQEPTHLN